MCMEIVTDRAGLLEAGHFAGSHPLGSFMQSPRWAQVKPAWDSHMVVSRRKDGMLQGSMLVLALADRGDGRALLYAPRGPVCDLRDEEVLGELLEGARRLSQQYGHGIFKCDPLLHAADTDTIRSLTDAGLQYDAAAPSIQPKENAVRRGLAGLTSQQLFDSFSSKTQFYIQSAAQYGVECTTGTVEDLAEFYPVYAAMGQRKGFALRPQRYFYDMLTAFGDDARLFLCRRDGVLLAGAIAIAFGGRVSYVYGASDRTNPEYAVGYRLQWEMLLFTLQRGCDAYDLGGICTDPARAPALHELYRFKRKFAKAEEYAGDFSFVF